MYPPLNTSLHVLPARQRFPPTVPSPGPTSGWPHARSGAKRRATGLGMDKCTLGCRAAGDGSMHKSIVRRNSSLHFLPARQRFPPTVPSPGHTSGWIIARSGTRRRATCLGMDKCTLGCRAAGDGSMHISTVRCGKEGRRMGTSWGGRECNRLLATSLKTSDRHYYEHWPTYRAPPNPSLYRTNDATEKGETGTRPVGVWRSRGEAVNVIALFQHPWKPRTSTITNTGPRTPTEQTLRRKKL